MVSIAFADGEVDDGERAMLKTMKDVLDVSDAKGKSRVGSVDSLDQNTAQGPSQSLEGEVSDKKSEFYVKRKKEACERVGIKGIIKEIDNKISTEEFIGKIGKMNDDKNINGILFQTPLPSQINEIELSSSISLKKDVDGLNPESVGRILYTKGKIKPIIQPVELEVFSDSHKKLIDEILAYL